MSGHDFLKSFRVLEIIIGTYVGITVQIVKFGKKLSCVTL